MLKNIKEVKSVTFYDLSEYEEDKSRDGGRYGFWAVYKRINEDSFQLSFHTTAEFSYCPVCGSFGSHYEGDSPYESGYSCGEYSVVSEKELLELINSFSETNDKYFVIE